MKDPIREDWRTALDAIIAGDGRLGPYNGPCWMSRRILEISVEASVIDTLIAEGWLESWDGILDGPAITLTPYAADQLGVELMEVGMDETPVWAQRGDIDPNRPIRSKRADRERPLPYPELLLDDAPPVEDIDLDEFPATVPLEPVRLWGQLVNLARQTGGAGSAPPTRRRRAG